MAQIKISAERMQRIYTYARLEEFQADPEVSSVVQSLAEAAVEYLANAGIRYSADSALYELALKGLVAHWYDNRDAISPASNAQTPLGLRTIITQLKLTSVPESGTEA